MNQLEFNCLMEAFTGAFGSKPSQETRDFCWVTCKDIPGQHTQQIISRIGDLEKKPSNYSHAIRAAYRSVSGTGESYETKQCAECSDGFISISRPEKTGMYSMRCATCNPAAEIKATAAQLRANGWTVHLPRRSTRICTEAEAAAWIKKIQKMLYATRSPAQPQHDYGTEVPF